MGQVVTLGENRRMMERLALKKKNTREGPDYERKRGTERAILLKAGPGCGAGG